MNILKPPFSSGIKPEISSKSSEQAYDIGSIATKGFVQITSDRSTKENFGDELKIRNLTVEAEDLARPNEQGDGNYSNLTNAA